MDPLANAYLKVITESSDELTSKDQKVNGYSPKIGQAFGDDKNAKKLQPKTGPEDSEGTEDVEDPKEADSRLSAGKENDGTPRKLNDSKNPFDALYNRIISEEGIMDFSTDSENPEDSSFEPNEDEGHEDDSEFGEGDEDEDMGEDEDEVSFTLPRELAEKLHEVLGAVLGGEEGEEESEESEDHEFGGEEGEGEEPAFGEEEEESSQEGAKPFGESYEGPKMKKCKKCKNKCKMSAKTCPKCDAKLATEATEMEEWGTALEDQDKLEAGFTNKSNYTVKGAVPVSKKKAQVPTTGKGFDGKLKPHQTSGAVSKLQSKKQDTGGVKTGKFLFDNE